jgi:hypothetical protein
MRLSSNYRAPSDGQDEEDEEPLLSKRKKRHLKKPKKIAKIKEADEILKKNHLQ